MRSRKLRKLARRCTDRLSSIADISRVEITRSPAHNARIAARVYFETYSEPARISGTTTETHIKQIVTEELEKEGLASSDGYTVAIFFSGDASLLRPHLEKWSTQLEAELRDAAPIHKLVLDARQLCLQIEAYIFFVSDEDLNRCRQDGTTELIESRVRKLLDDKGVGESDGVEVVCLYDSHETVERDWNGDYYLWMRG